VKNREMLGNQGNTRIKDDEIGSSAKFLLFEK
jgi:hypothetical protein